LSTQPQPPPERRWLIEGYVELSGLAKNVLNESNLLIDREVDRMRATAAATQRALFIELAAAFPLGLAIAALFAFLIARPIRQLDRAIRRLGRAVRRGADIQARPTSSTWASASNGCGGGWGRSRSRRRGSCATSRTS
jgi:hypothetical protein